MDTFADGDELRGLRITLLVGHAHIDDLDGRDGGGDLLEIERCVGVGSFLLLRSGSLGSGGSLGGLDVLAVTQELDQLDSLTGADDDVPLGQLVLDLALHNSDLARDDEGAVVDLGGDIEFVKELLDGRGGELACSPCCQNGHTGCVGDEQVHGNLGALEFAGDQEVGQREVDRQRAGIVGTGAVDGVDAGGDLHRLLRVGEDVLAQAVERQRLSVADLVHDDDGAVLDDEHGGQSRLEMLVMVAQNAQIDDGGIAEGLVTVLDGRTADKHGVCERLLDGGGGHIENEILVAGLFKFGNGVVQFGQIRTADAQNEARRLGDLVHGREGILVRAVQDGLIVLDRLDGGLCRLDVLGVDDNGAVGQSSCLFAEFDELRAVARVVNEDALDHFAFADTLVIDLLDALKTSLNSRIVHAGAQRGRKQVAVDEGLLMTHHDGLAAKLVRADLDGLHGRLCSLGQKCDRLFRHIRALGNGNSALCDLHAECHAGGAAAFLTVFLRR